MVTEEGLRFILDGDADTFVRSQKDALTAAENTAKGIVAASKRIQGAGNYIDAMQNDLRGLVNGLKNGEAQFVGFGLSVSKSGQIVEQFGNTIQDLQRRQKSVSGVTNSFNQILRETPNFAINANIGILALSNNLPIFFEAVQRAAQGGQGFRAVLSGLGASLFSIGGVLQLGVTLLTIFSDELFGTKKAAKDAASEIKTLVAINKSFSESLQANNASALAEVSTLNRLFDIAKDEAKSRRDRVQALKELKEATNGYLDTLTLETINTDKARKALDEFNKSLFASALLKANQKRVDEMAESYGKFAQIGIDGKKRIDELNKAITEANKPGADIDGESRFDRVVRLSRERAKLITETNTAIKQQNGLYDEILATGTKIANLQVQLNPFKDQKGSGNNDKNIKTASDVIKELEKDITALNAKFTVSNDSLSVLAGQTLKRLTQALGELSEVGLGPTDTLFTSIQSRIKTLQDNLVKTPVTIPINITIPGIPSIRDQVVRQTADAVKAGADTLGLELSEFNKAVGKILGDSTRDAVASVSAGIGQAIAEGNSKALIETFVNSVAGLLQQLGKLLIAQGIGIEAFKTSLKTLQGIPAIIAGAAMVAAGAAFRAAIPSFATGGTVYGPQLIAAGDNSTNKEHILSDIQLQKIAQGAGITSGGNMVVESRISGTDLVLLFNRATAATARGNG